MKRWMIWGIAILGVVVISLFIFLQSRWLTPANQPNHGTVAATSTPSGEVSVPDMQKQLMNPQLDPASRASLTEKIEIAQRETQNAAAGEANPAPKTPQPQPNQAVPSLLSITPGISDGSQGMIKPSQANILNNWHGMRDGRIVTAFAGSKADDPSAGLILVLSINADPNVNDTQIDTFSAPGAAGPLRIASEKDGVLTLTGAGGQLVKFDLTGRTYIP